MTDLDTMISVFDEAINSDDPRVRQALNSLVMLVQLTRDSDNTLRQGPLADMQRQLRDMQAELKRMQYAIDMMKHVETKYDWTSIYKHKIEPKMRGRSINHVWLDESATLPSDLFKETK